ncbi:CpaF family protein [Oceanisphaera sp. KMM 10153]|uniref:CpaF family protein n=1 Tax=Oceanisphaera submarina TaxID=3390193 RepID=UPI003975E14C
MSHEPLFGQEGHQSHHAPLLKGALHRYIIDALEEQPDHLLDSSRHLLVQFVNTRVGEYTKVRHIPLSRYEQDKLTEELVDELVGFGPLEVLLRDSSVTEILVNGPHRIFIERKGTLHRSDLRFIDDAHLLRVIQRILAPVGRRLDESSPMVDARMPDGSRINAVIPPVAIDGPSLSVRKFRQDMLKSADLLASGSLDKAMLNFMELAVTRRCNILVSGGTGTGKTTMLNMLSQIVCPAERIVTIEDTAELQLKHEHVVRLETRPPNADGYGEIAARDLVRNALRMRPDRIILGEIRGGEVLDVLMAMNTGHDGSMTTLHANNAQDALLRLESLVGMSGLQVAERTLRQTICSAIDVVIQLVRLADGRRCISEILEVVALRDNQYVTNTLFKLQRDGARTFVREAVNPGGEKLQNIF